MRWSFLLLCGIGVAGCLAELPPPAPVVTIEPAEPGPDDELLARIDAPSTDPAGTPVALLITWVSDGVTISAGGGTRIPAERTEVGQRWTLSVTASIGDSVSPPGTATVTIGAAPGDDDATGDDDTGSDDDSSPDDDTAGDDDIAPEPIPGGLCAASGTASNGTYTAETCTGPAAGGARASNGTFTVNARLGGTQ